MILTHDLTKTFPSSSGDVCAVDRLSFQVSNGETFGLLGANGAGKTTTLRMILGLLEPTSGYTQVDGFRTTECPDEVKRRVGLVSTSAGLYQWLSPREVLRFFAELYGLSDEATDANLNRLIELFELKSFLDRRCANLSTGQKQRVNLARSLVHDPPVVLLDEPTRGLDVVGCRTVFDYVRVLRESGKSVILCTHRVDEAERVCDRFGLMHRGRFALEGTLLELEAATNRKTLTDVFLYVLDHPELVAPSSLAPSGAVSNVDDRQEEFA